MLLNKTTYLGDLFGTIWNMGINTLTAQIKFLRNALDWPMLLMLYTQREASMEWLTKKEVTYQEGRNKGSY